MVFFYIFLLVDILLTVLLFDANTNSFPYSTNSRKVACLAIKSSFCFWLFATHRNTRSDCRVTCKIEKNLLMIKLSIFRELGLLMFTFEWINVIHKYDNTFLHCCSARKQYFKELLLYPIAKFQITQLATIT